MINVGIIGSGFIVPAFIESTKLMGGYNYRAIASPVEEQLISLKEKYGIGYYSLNNEDVFNDPEVDVIYVAVPNGLHFAIAKAALEHNKHCIVEKPFTASYKEAKELVELAHEKGKILFEAITLAHMPNYAKIRELLPELGEIKMVDLNFSQYSSRYDKFKKGIVLPAFDIKQAGGALMDLGIYNIHFIVGLFGLPKTVNYFANITKNIDTSGVLVLDYEQFKVTAVAAKDCRAPLNVCIQGDLGYIKSDEASSVISHVRHVKNDGSFVEYTLNVHPEEPHYHEYEVFARIFNENDMETAYKYNQLTLDVMSVIDKALASANIVFE